MIAHADLFHSSNNDAQKALNKGNTVFPVSRQPYNIKIIPRVADLCYNIEMARPVFHRIELTL